LGRTVLTFLGLVILGLGDGMRGNDMGDFMELADAIITTSYADGILIAEHQGSYGLIATTRGSSDNNYKQWVFLSKWQNSKPVPNNKKQPMAVRLGKDPVKVLEQLIVELKRKGL